MSDPLEPWRAGPTVWDTHGRPPWMPMGQAVRIAAATGPLQSPWPQPPSNQKRRWVTGRHLPQGSTSCPQRGSFSFGSLEGTRNATMCPRDRWVGEGKFYFTFAAPSILLQNVAFRAWTLVTPFCVLADKIAGFGGLVALIQIYDQRDTMWPPII